jgi:putative transposase
VGHLIDRYRIGVRRACGVVKQSRSAGYCPPRENDDAPLLGRIEEIAAVRVRYGFWRIFVLLRREGWKVNHKRVYRLYCRAGLNLRRKRPRRRKAAAHRVERTVLTAPNQAWSMDFVADALFDGRRFRALTVVDNFTKESPSIEVDQLTIISERTRRSEMSRRPSSRPDSLPNPMPNFQFRPGLTRGGGQRYISRRTALGSSP